MVLLLSLHTYSCSHVINSLVENIQYLVKKNVFIFLKLESASLYKMLDIINLSFSIFCRCHSVSTAATFSYDEDRENAP
jgi:hypothetical protein